MISLRSSWGRSTLVVELLLSVLYRHVTAAQLSPLADASGVGGATFRQIVIDPTTSALYLAGEATCAVYVVPSLRTQSLTASWPLSIFVGPIHNHRVPYPYEVAPTVAEYYHPPAIVGWPLYALGHCGRRWMGLFVGDQNHAITFINFRRGNNVTLVAGSSSGAYGATDGIGSAALLFLPQNLAWGRFQLPTWTSVIYWTENGNHCVRQGIPVRSSTYAYLDRTDVDSLQNMVLNVSVFAGLCGSGGSGAGLSYRRSVMNAPYGIAVVNPFNVNQSSSDTSAVFVGDSGNFRLLLITPMYPFHAQTSTVIDTGISVTGITVARLVTWNSQDTLIELFVGTGGTSFLNYTVFLTTNMTSLLIINSVLATGVSSSLTSALVSTLTGTMIVFGVGSTLKYYCCLGPEYILAEWNQTTCSETVSITKETSSSQSVSGDGTLSATASRSASSDGSATSTLKPPSSVTTSISSESTKTLSTLATGEMSMSRSTTKSTSRSKTHQSSRSPTWSPSNRVTATTTVPLSSSRGTASPSNESTQTQSVAGPSRSFTRTTTVLPTKSVSTTWTSTLHGPRTRTRSTATCPTKSDPTMPSFSWASSWSRSLSPTAELPVPIAPFSAVATVQITSSIFTAMGGAMGSGSAVMFQRLVSVVGNQNCAVIEPPTVTAFPLQLPLWEREWAVPADDTRGQAITVAWRLNSTGPVDPTMVGHPEASLSLTTRSSSLYRGIWIWSVVMASAFVVFRAAWLTLKRRGETEEERQWRRLVRLAAVDGVWHRPEVPGHPDTPKSHVLPWRARVTTWAYHFEATSMAASLLRNYVPSMVGSAVTALTLQRGQVYQDGVLLLLIVAVSVLTVGGILHATTGQRMRAVMGVDLALVSDRAGLKPVPIYQLVDEDEPMGVADQLREARARYVGPVVASWAAVHGVRDALRWWVLPRSAWMPRKVRRDPRLWNVEGAYRIRMLEDLIIEYSPMCPWYTVVDFVLSVLMSITGGVRSPSRATCGALFILQVVWAAVAFVALLILRPYASYLQLHFAVLMTLCTLIITIVSIIPSAEVSAGSVTLFSGALMIVQFALTFVILRLGRGRPAWLQKSHDVLKAAMASAPTKRHETALEHLLTSDDDEDDGSDTAVKLNSMDRPRNDDVKPVRRVIVLNDDDDDEEMYRFAARGAMNPLREAYDDVDSPGALCSVQLKHDIL